MVKIGNSTLIGESGVKIVGQPNFNPLFTEKRVSRHAPVDPLDFVLLCMISL
jgi:hypothetical protein